MCMFGKKLLELSKPVSIDDIKGRVINQNVFDVLPLLPKQFIDLLILDPPYNLTKNYHGNIFRSKEHEQYSFWFNRVIEGLLPCLRFDATVYVCSDWRTSNIIFPILDKYFYVRNRITWEREKGRGAKTNWKNNTEDIWFCTVSNDYTFNVNDVKLKKRVKAPYKSNGKPKDWKEGSDGKFRFTYPSNIWTDITVPFWSMKENTDHPTQKPEKLLAKLILASSNKGNMVFDPFLGSGTSAVTASKLDRRFCGIEFNKMYCCWAIKRLFQAAKDKRIQGYDGVFYDRHFFG